MTHFKYDHLTDEELLRLVAFETDPLLLAVAERLEIRNRDLYDNQAQPRPIDTFQRELDLEP